MSSSPGPPPTGELNIAAASNLQFALREIIAAFEREQPRINVEATYGSSGNFYAQICNKAPFDVFLSADTDYPHKLIEQGVAVKATEFRYAVGHLVVWVRNDSPLNLQSLGMQALVDPAVRKVAIANPKHAPYGRAAVAAMNSLGVYERVQDRLVLGENITQAAQFVEAGGADAGILALSLAIAPQMRDRGRFWMVPQDAYPALEQAGVILNWAQDRAAADQFKAFLSSAPARVIFQQYGFFSPKES